MAKNKKLSAVSKKHYTQAELENKQKEEAVLYEFAPLDFSIKPKNLDVVGLSEWIRLQKIVEGSKLPISELDRAIVENYCTYVSISQRAKEELNKSELLDAMGKATPLVNILNSANRELKSLANALGLTIDSRMRIANPSEEKEADDPFAKFFGDVND